MTPEGEAQKVQTVAVIFIATYPELGLELPTVDDCEAAVIGGDEDGAAVAA